MYYILLTGTAANADAPASNLIIGELFFLQVDLTPVDGEFRV